VYCKFEDANIVTLWGYFIICASFFRLMKERRDASSCLGFSRLACLTIRVEWSGVE